MEWNYRRNFRRWKNIQENRFKEQMIPIYMIFLSGRGEQFKRCGKEYRWLRHDSVIIHGKGRKQREVPLWKTTVKYINKYLKPTLLNAPIIFL